MNAFHANWTAPFFARNPAKNYYIEDYEFLTAILSALKWRQYNGSIALVTDETGADYFRGLGLEHIWDLGFDTSLEKIRNIAPDVFWAAGKLFALQTRETPAVMIDTDFVVWKNIDTQLGDTELAVIHREPIGESIYPGRAYFTKYLKDGYDLNTAWDWKELPCNTAFLFINNAELKDRYTRESIYFMENIQNAPAEIPFMVFAEQRLIAMNAKECQVSIKSLIDLKDSDNQDCFSHLWGYKDRMKRDFRKRSSFCMGCIKKIVNDFPEEKEAVLSAVGKVYPYYLSV